MMTNPRNSFFTCIWIWLQNKQKTLSFTDGVFKNNIVQKLIFRKRSRDIARRNRSGGGFEILSPVAACFGYNDRGENTEQRHHNRQDPGALFQYIIGLLYSHELIAEAGNISCQSTAFGVLYQNDQSQ